MRIGDRGASFFRRLYVFYLFTFVLLLFFGFFYYKYIPENQSELDSRGFRILNQLSTNIVQKNREIGATFNNFAKYFGPKDVQAEMYRQIYPNIHYEIINQDTDKKKLYRPIDQHEGGWYFFYPLIDTLHKENKGIAIIKIDDFLQPVLEARDDLFDSYVLLQKNEDTLARRPGGLTGRVSGMTVLYMQKNLSASTLVNTDSALALQKNTDLSSVTDIQISGTPYKLFSRTFSVEGEQLVLAGLMTKAGYDRKVKALPVRFISILLISILIGVIFLPFIKVFMLSPKENMNRVDVLGTTVSIYVGSAILILIAFYLVVYYVTTATFNHRLEGISDKITSGIGQEFKDANNQLDAYSKLYGTLSEDQKATLYYGDTNAKTLKIVDQLFTPQIYRNIYRVFWIDTGGNTLAKWNPFDFNAPLTKTNDYKFFKLLQDKIPTDQSMIVYPGKSNATNEFQVFFMKRSAVPVTTTGRIQKESMAIGIAGFLDCTLRPVLPAGFGFCIVDNATGDVLIHSDYRRDLSENILTETENNERLQNCLQNKTKAPIEDVNIYGLPHLVFVNPIAGQELSLVTFYNTDLYSVNIFRMVHFVGESILYIFLALAACIFFSTVYSAKPTKLKFRINPREWVRPWRKNILSYIFTFKFFLALITISVILFAIVLFSDADIRNIYYLSLFIPFYAMWGFLASRRKEKMLFDNAFASEGDPSLIDQLEQRLARLKRFPLLELIWLSKTAVFFIILVNWIVYRLISNEHAESPTSISYLIAIFQIVTIGILVFFYRLTFSKGLNLYVVNFSVTSVSVSQARTNFSFYYIWSLYFSVLLAGIIPVAGIILYALKSEKIQYCKTNEFAIAASDQIRQHYIIGALLPGYKKAVREKLGDAGYFDSLLDKRSFYLTGEQIIHSSMSGGKSPFQDEPYVTMLDDLFLVTSGEYNSYSLHEKAADASWTFSFKAPTDVLFNKTIRRDGNDMKDATSQQYRNIQIASGFSDLLYSFSNVTILFPIILIILSVLFLVFGPRFFTMLVNRIFLLNFLPRDYKVTRNNLYLQRFFAGGYKPPMGFKTKGKAFAPLDDQEIYILNLTLTYEKQYQLIWDSLEKDEQYMLYDFALDGYTNYKDALTIIKLLQKDILVYNHNELKFFQLSFRNFVLLKKGTPEIEKLKQKYSVPGLWQTIRIPALILFAATAIFLLLTQENVSHKLAGLVTSMGALIPLVMEITKRTANKAS